MATPETLDSPNIQATPRLDPIRPSDKPYSRTALAALPAALALGVVGDLLFFGTEPGLNILLAVVALIATAYAVSRRTGGALRWADGWLLIAVGFASCQAIRDAENLRALDLLATLLALALGSMSNRIEPHLGKLQDYAATVLRSAGHLAFGPLLLAGQDADWHAAAGHRKSRLLAPILLGLIIAVPVGAVFIGLFASADPTFADLVASLARWDLTTVFQHTMVSLFLAWLCAGTLRSWLWKPQMEALPIPQVRLGAVPVGMVLGTMVTIFLTFAAIQAGYWFGGDALVRSVDGMTYAGYLHEGFYQMVAAVMLAIPLLYFADTQLAGASARAVQSIRALSAVQLGLVGLTVVSAGDRVRIYVAAYGLTADRLTVTAIVTWLLLVTGWFGVTVLRGRRERFTFGALMGGYAVLGALNAVNPDALIARTNLARDAHQLKVDTNYLARLSFDAVPVLATRVSAMAMPERCEVARKLYERGIGDDPPWQQWNLSVKRGRTIAQSVNLTELGCN